MQLRMHVLPMAAPDYVSQQYSGYNQILEEVHVPARVPGAHSIQERVCGWLNRRDQQGLLVSLGYVVLQWSV